jgi:hypothetical protein
VEHAADAAIIRIYARETATQRGNSSTAVAGTVASAVRFLKKAILTGTSGEITGRSMETACGQIASDKGIGRELIVEFLDGVPGMTENAVKEQLANPKSSGDYARIIGDVKDEIERENREALKELERVERERQKAEEAERKAELSGELATELGNTPCLDRCFT